MNLQKLIYNMNMFVSFYDEFQCKRSTYLTHTQRHYTTKILWYTVDDMKSIRQIAT